MSTWPFVGHRRPVHGVEGTELRQIFEAEDFGAELTPELREQESRLRAQAAAAAKK